ncbi:KEOPS complex Pcc1-like subunit [Halobacteriales archaeon QH_7_69_31]|nr:MAG: KEOPS complex Pcc1-like subunit [Halobacteriales archaeon QH_7_69_31]
MTPVATLRTRHDHPAVVAAAVRPDNTDEMTTRVAVSADGDRVVETTISRDSTGGLRTTVDDYVTNLAVADRLTDHDTQP